MKKIDYITAKPKANELHLCRGETCSLYLAFEKAKNKGRCELDNEIVNINAGCKRPELCSKLKVRNIEVVYL